MKQIVNRFIKKHSLLCKGATVVVGVSGGPDSIALLHYLVVNQSLWRINVIAVAVDHGLRGKESEEDLLFVKKYCEHISVPFIGKKVDVQNYKKIHRVSTQVAARNCRYDCFKEVIEQYDAKFLALAHHGDDQIETMLMRQVRGAHGYGLAGIKVKRPFYSATLIRPFLTVNKADIEQYCKEYHLDYRIDQSNFQEGYVRNRFRAHILPFLKKENPKVHERFQQQSELRYEDEAFLVELAKKELESVIVSKNEQKVIICNDTYNRLPIPLQRRGFQLILNYLYNETPPEISTFHMDEFISLLKRKLPSGSLHFPKGLYIQKSYNKCLISYEEKLGNNEFEHRLVVPGIVTLEKGKIIAKLFHTKPDIALTKNVCLCDAKGLTGDSLIVRTRKRGDRMTVFGMQGTKKLKDIFIDAKVEQDERDSWPIITTSEDTIIWIPGIKRSNVCLISEETKRFLLIQYIQ